MQTRIGSISFKTSHGVSPQFLFALSREIGSAVLEPISDFLPREWLQHLGREPAPSEACQSDQSGPEQVRSGRHRHRRSRKRG